MGQMIVRAARIGLASVSAVLLACLAAPSLAEGVNLPMEGIAAGTFYLEADVTGLGPVDFLVDTGSGYTTIDTLMLEAMSQNGEIAFVKHLEGIMADGSRKVVPVYQIPEIRLGSCLLRDVQAAVFGAGTRPILGMRALSRVAPFTFSTHPPTLSLSRCDATITAEAALETAAG